MSFFRKKTAASPGIEGLSGDPAMTRARALTCRPVRNPEVESQERGEGLLLLYPVVLKPWIGAITRRLGARDRVVTKRLELDAIGRRTWEWIDGRRDVAALVGLLAETYGLHGREAEVSMTAFLRELGRRGLVGFAEGSGHER